MSFEPDILPEPENDEEQKPEEPEEDEWWLQQQTNAAAEHRPNFAPISDIWPFRPRFDRFTRLLHYRGPFMKILKKHRQKAAELDDMANAEEADKKEAEKQEEPTGDTPSVGADVNDDEDGYSTDMEHEVKQATSGEYYRKNRENEVQALIRKYTGPIAITDKDTMALLRNYVKACTKMKVPILRAVVKALAHDATTVVDIRHCSTSYESMKPLIAVLEVT